MSELQPIVFGALHVTCRDAGRSLLQRHWHEPRDMLTLPFVKRHPKGLKGKGASTFGCDHDAKRSRSLARTPAIESWIRLGFALGESMLAAGNVGGPQSLVDNPRFAGDLVISTSLSFGFGFNISISISTSISTRNGDWIHGLESDGHVC